MLLILASQGLEKEDKIILNNAVKQSLRGLLKLGDLPDKLNQKI